MKRKTIGESPLDALLSKPRKTSSTKKAHNKPQNLSNAVRERVTVSLPSDLIEECRNAVVALSGPPLRLTLAGMVEEALHRELVLLKRAQNDGKDFPERESQLRPGRPMR